MGECPVTRHINPAVNRKFSFKSARPRSSWPQRGFPVVLSVASRTEMAIGRCRQRARSAQISAEGRAPSGQDRHQRVPPDPVAVRIQMQPVGIEVLGFRSAVGPRQRRERVADRAVRIGTGERDDAGVQVADARRKIFSAPRGVTRHQTTGTAGSAARMRSSTTRRLSAICAGLVSAARSFVPIRITSPRGSSASTSSCNR